MKAITGYIILLLLLPRLYAMDRGLMEVPDCEKYSVPTRFVPIKLGMSGYYILSDNVVSQSKSPYVMSIIADDVTLDLNQKTIYANASSIAIAVHARNVVIKNGTIDNAIVSIESKNHKVTICDLIIHKCGPQDIKKEIMVPKASLIKKVIIKEMLIISSLPVVLTASGTYLINSNLLYKKPQGYKPYSAAIYIKGNDITLNLNKSNIDCNGAYYGIYVADMGAKNIEIKNGTIKNAVIAIVSRNNTSKIHGITVKKAFPLTLSSEIQIGQYGISENNKTFFSLNAVNAMNLLVPSRNSF